MAVPFDDMIDDILALWRERRSNAYISPTVVEAIRHDLDVREEERNKMELSNARDAGFSSVEDYEEALIKEDEEREARWRKRVEEETGKTWAEYWATHPQRAKTPPESFPRCDCKDHPIPMFCAKSLVEYRTQDAAGLTDFLAKGDQDIRNLKVNANEKSRRLSPEMLKQRWERQRWERETQDTSSEWPPWLKGDSVLCRIGQRDEYNSDQKRNEIFPDTRIRRGTPSSIFTEDRSDAEMSDGTTPSTPKDAPFGVGNSIITAQNKVKVKGCRADGSFLLSDELGDIQIAPQRPMRKKRTITTRRSQPMWPSCVRKITRQTRSQKATKFYELATDGTTRIRRRY